MAYEQMPDLNDDRIGELDTGTDLFKLVCGEKIATGSYRTVYGCLFDRTKVLKHDTAANWSNVNEFQFWHAAKGTRLEPWLAPCWMLSPRGWWLLQSRTRPIKIGDYPKRVPSVLADIKPENWGTYRGRPVCHDYGNHMLIEAAIGKAKLEAVTWEHHV